MARRGCLTGVVLVVILVLAGSARADDLLERARDGVGDTAAQIAEARKRLDGRLDAEQAVVIRETLAELLRTASCPVTERDGLCVRLFEDTSPDRCEPKTIVQLAGVKRHQTENTDALELARAAVAAYAHIAEPTFAAREAADAAMRMLVDEDLERMLVVAAERPVNLRAWVQRIRKLEERVQDRYSSVMMNSHTIDGAFGGLFRVGQTEQAVANALVINAPAIQVPADKLDALCSALEAQSHPIMHRALEVYADCIKRSQQVLETAWTKLCWREAERLAPEQYPPALELQPSPRSLVVVVEGN